MGTGLIHRNKRTLLCTLTRGPLSPGTSLPLMEAQAPFPSGAPGHLPECPLVASLCLQLHQDAHKREITSKS